MAILELLGRLFAKQFELPLILELKNHYISQHAEKPFV